MRAKHVKIIAMPDEEQEDERTPFLNVDLSASQRTRLLGERLRRTSSILADFL